MRTEDARNRISTWIAREAERLPGFDGAMFHGSSLSWSSDSSLSPTSDIDVLIVCEDPAGMRGGKQLVDDVVVDLTFLTHRDIASAERVMREYRLAPTFAQSGIIRDPNGTLTRLHDAIARDFRVHKYVSLRCENARDNALRHLENAIAGTSFPVQFTGWLFGAGVLSHIVLVAGLRNPTIRRRYDAAREVMSEYAMFEAYERLLEVLGCRQMRMERVREHFAAMTEAFETASAAKRSPFVYGADIGPLGRPSAIDGTAELIAQGHHREAVFWIAATYARCMMVLEKDGDEAQIAAARRGFEALASDLGVSGGDAVTVRCDDVRQALPDVWSAAEYIMAANPEIVG